MRLLFWTILWLSLVTVAEKVAAGRATRSLAFKKGSSFFYRLNFKITLFPTTTIFAQAAGFKVVWELPTDARRFGRSIADIHEAVELLYESHGFDGRSCLLKNLCEAMDYVSQREGVIAKILKLLVGPYVSDGKSILETVNCDIHVTNCPLQLIGLDTFVDQ
ncbi:uncharacterized protein LOC143181832 [Calliopsis andreniformis]|uniref:uncharacterized protein LOC143181832 n=1 Tax=Calliopsis andreniformis TaxID=337506 RepID=UPI003FCE607A